MTSEQAEATVTRILVDMQARYEQRGAGQFLVTLPGTRRLQTPCWLLVGERTLHVQAFVCRRPDENFEGVYRFLLQRNARLYCVGYTLDRMGDIHLLGSLPLDAITTDHLDRVLGQVLEAADGDFNRILELGFASSIRQEFAWRTKNGESVANLHAFARLLT